MKLNTQNQQNKLNTRILKFQLDNDNDTELKNIKSINVNTRNEVDRGYYMSGMNYGQYFKF